MPYAVLNRHLPPRSALLGRVVNQGGKFFFLSNVSSHGNSRVGRETPEDAIPRWARSPKHAAYLQEWSDYQTRCKEIYPL
jgi:hypothetical protein